MWLRSGAPRRLQLSALRVVSPNSSGQHGTVPASSAAQPVRSIKSLQNHQPPASRLQKATHFTQSLNPAAPQPVTSLDPSLLLRQPPSPSTPLSPASSHAAATPARPARQSSRPTGGHSAGISMAQSLEDVTSRNESPELPLPLEAQVLRHAAPKVEARQNTEVAESSASVLRAMQVIQGEMRALHSLMTGLDKTFHSAVGLLESRGKGARVLVSGVGKSGHVAHKIAASLSSLGTPAIFLHATEALHGDLGLAREGDVALLLSYSGETVELISVNQALNQMGVKTIAVTKGHDNSLARESDLSLSIGRHEEVDENRLAPTASAVAMMAMGDAIAVVLSERAGFTKKDFARHHPGGSLGKILRHEDL